MSSNVSATKVSRTCARSPRTLLIRPVPLIGNPCAGTSSSASQVIISVMHLPIQEGTAAPSADSLHLENPEY